MEKEFAVTPYYRRTPARGVRVYLKDAKGNRSCVDATRGAADAQRRDLHPRNAGRS